MKKHIIVKKQIYDIEEKGTTTTTPYCAPETVDIPDAFCRNLQLLSKRVARIIKFCSTLQYLDLWHGIRTCSTVYISLQKAVSELS